MRRLEGRTVLVAGAGAVAEGWSNGRACAVAYARAGARVVCVDVSLGRAAQTADIIAGEGGEALALAADAGDETAMRATVAAAVGRFGGLDVLHNNVGVGGSIGLPDQIAPDAWDREVRQNLTTAYVGIRCAVPQMRAQGGGAIVNISSLSSVRFLKKPSVGYSAAKAGLEGLTRACAAGYGRDNIRVNCIRVGFAETPLIRLGLAARGLTPEAEDAEMAKSRAKVPLRGEHTDPFDVAEAAVFLASDSARHITGVVLNVDGGLEWAPL